MAEHELVADGCDSIPGVDGGRAPPHSPLTFGVGVGVGIDGGEGSVW